MPLVLFFYFTVCWGVLGLFVLELSVGLWERGCVEWVTFHFSIYFRFPLLYFYFFLLLYFTRVIN